MVFANWDGGSAEMFGINQLSTFFSKSACFYTYYSCTSGTEKEAAENPAFETARQAATVTKLRALTIVPRPSLLMLGQCRRRWANIKPALGQRLAFPR